MTPDLLPDQVRRRDATARTHAAYVGRLFAWESGHTCLHMARFHLRGMGHAVPRLPRVSSALFARRALDRRGWTDVDAMLDSMLPRIAPLQMRLGDIATAPGLGGIGAMFICIPPFKLLGWHEESDRAVVIDFNRDVLTGVFRV